MSFRIVLLASAAAIASSANAQVSTSTGDTDSPPEANASSDAQSEDVPSGEIVVTATRRNESLLDVPISVAAYSQEVLDTKGVKGIGDLSRITPGLTLTPGWAGSTSISIRGVSSGIGAGTTGIYIDDTPIQTRELGAGATSTNAYPAVFDLARVEVLRGPQGTLFGAGSEGGTVRFISPDPSLNEYTGYGRAEVAATEGGDPSFEAGVALGGPIVENSIGFRVSGFYRRDGGWVDRVAYPGGSVVDENSNTVKTAVVRGALAFAPLDGLTITPSIYHQKIVREDTNQYWTFLSDPERGEFLNGQALKQPGSDRLTLYANKLEFELGGVDLVSNTSFLVRDDISLADYTHYAAELLGAPFDIPQRIGALGPTDMINRQRSFTQEVRLQSAGGSDARINWVVGVFYQNARQYAEEYVRIPELDLLSNTLFGAPAEAVFGIGNLPGDVSYFGVDRARDRQLAAFGQVDFELLPRLTLIAGARIAKTKFDFDNSQGGPFNGGPTGTSGKQAESPFTPKVGVNFEPNDDLLIYASAAKGFRTGGANPPVPTQRCITDLDALGISQAPEAYNSDSVWSYELGAKGRPVRSVQFEASAYRIDWTDIQNSVGLPSCGFGYIANLGTARIEGFDARVSVNPLLGLTLDASVGYTDARYSSTILGAPLANGQRGIIVAEGDRLNVAPWSVNLAGDYEFPLGGDDLQGYVHADYDYRSAFRFGSPTTISYDPLDDRRESSHFVSARVGVRHGDLDVSAFVTNLFNSTDVLSRTHDTLGSDLLRDVTFRPRTLGLTASMRY